MEVVVVVVVAIVYLQESGSVAFPLFSEGEFAAESAGWRKRIAATALQQPRRLHLRTTTGRQI